MFKHLSNLSHHAAWRRQLELLLDSAGEGIYGIDLRGRCVFINKAGAELLGYSADEVLGRNMHYLMHHSYANRDLMPVCDCQIFKAFQNNRGCRVDNEVLWRRDGTCFHAEYASYPIFDGEQVVGAVVTFNDITARVEAQNIKQAAQTELERRVAERTAQLQTAHDRMRRLSSHLTTVREEERIRIARELHDDLGARLTALDLELKALAYRLDGQANFASRLRTMTELTEGAMESLRTILSDLRPGVLDHLGLWAALEHLLQEFESRTGIACRWMLAPTLEKVRLSKRSETSLYRIVQEALHNVHKHAAATEVQLRITHADRSVLFEIQDNGHGMVHRAGQNGFGLMGIEERAWDMGAQFSIVSEPGQGVCIRLRLLGALSN
ncbi:MAG TPA: PAS domain-containing sensor histidine kinase [Limnobacter sp.]|nr:PAS domain-containing sensor histidine kinase [Limnobacter sp.]